jgi:hypothetical protein
MDIAFQLGINPKVLLIKGELWKNQNWNNSLKKKFLKL